MPLRHACRYHWIFANSVVLKILPVYPGRPVRLLGRAARLVTAPLRGLIWRTLNVVMLLHYRLPLRLWPRESLEREMMGAQGTAMCAPPACMHAHLKSMSQFELAVRSLYMRRCNVAMHTRFTAASARADSPKSTFAGRAVARSTSKWLR